MYEREGVVASTSLFSSLHVLGVLVEPPMVAGVEGCTGIVKHVPVALCIDVDGGELDVIIICCLYLTI